METNRYKLGQLLSIRNGKDYKILKPGKIPVFGSGGIMTYVDGFLYDKESILLPRKGTLNNIIYVDYPFWTVDTMYWSIINADLCYPKFLYYYLSCLDLSSRYQGSTLPSMTFDVYYDIDVDLPEMEIQRKIGDLLNLFDKKIETNKKIIDTLSETARTIYDYWFLQFEFPNEEGKPYKSSGGKMVWNEELERNIPEGWKSGRISDLGNIVGGGTPSTTHSEYYTKQGIAWMTPKDFAGSNNIFVSHGGRDITEDGLRNSSATLMPQGTVLMSSRAPIGYLGIASNELCTNQGFKSIVPTKSYCSEFIFFTLQTIMPYIKQFGTGSTFSEVSAGEFASVKVLLPHTKISNAFGEKISSIFAMIKNLEEENQRLSSLRDFLLPLLMNGQVLIG